MGNCAGNGSFSERGMPGSGKVHPQIEVGGVEVETLAGSQCRLVVVDSESGAGDRLAASVHIPCDPEARGPVVPVGRIPSTRDAARAHLHERLGRGVVDVRAIVGVHRRRVVLVSQPRRHGQSRCDPDTVLHECAVAHRAQPLPIVGTSAAGRHGEAKQQVCERVGGDRHLIGEREEPAGLHVAVAVLRHGPHVDAQLGQMATARPGERVGHLEVPRRAVLRVVVLAAERGEP